MAISGLVQGDIQEALVLRPEGVTRFDGSGFQNFTTERGLAHGGLNLDSAQI